MTKRWKKMDIEDCNIIGSGITQIATPAEVNRLCDVSNRIVTLVATGAITLALHEGKILLMGEVGGDAAATFTLPAATGSGAVYTFVVSVPNAQSYIIKALGDDIMQGSLAVVTDTTADLNIAFEAASDSDTITLNAGTTGGKSIGDEVILKDILADTWAVSGRTTASDSEATPFSATA